MFASFQLYGNFNSEGRLTLLLPILHISQHNPYGISLSKIGQETLFFVDSIVVYSLHDFFITLKEQMQHR